MTSALPSARGRLPSASPSRVLTDYATQVFRLDATEEGTGGPDAGKHDLLRVITYNRGREHMQPPTTAGATRNASAHRYHWDRMGMWVPEDAAKQQAMNVHPPKSPRAHSSRGSRGASRGGRIPSASVHQSTTMPVAPAPVTDVVAQSDIWARVVLPAVTWLSNWVDWNLTTTCLPDMIEKEHRMAFALATEQVTEALRLQPDRLSACIWRALVALLTHFVSKIEPLQRANATLRDETKAANNRALNSPVSLQMHWLPSKSTMRTAKRRARRRARRKMTRMRSSGQRKNPCDRRWCGANRPVNSLFRVKSARQKVNTFATS